MKKHILTLMVLMLAGIPCMAQKKTGTTQNIYVFGVAQSFADSVCYMSSVQRLEGVSLSHEGLLNDRAFYSESFAQYVQAQFGQTGTMGSIIFGRTRNDVEAKYLRVRSRYIHREQMKVKEIPVDDFAFKVRTYDYNN